MTRPKVRRGWSAIALAATAVAAFTLDQATKAWALSALSNGEIIQLVPTVRLELIFNPGVAFGIGANVGSPLVVGLMLVIAALIGWICVRLVRGDNLAGTIFLAAAAGGAAGNLWDRISRAENGALTGHVVDFIAVDWFAVFNVADIFTTCGIAAWAVTSLIRARRTPAQHEGPNPQLP